MKKNCENCIYLNWYERESYESLDESGFYCEGRVYGDRRENCEESHVEQLQDDDYRSVSKRCCILKEGE